jgi:transposase
MGIGNKESRMTKNVRPKPAAPVSKRRRFTDAFRREAVQMMLDGHSAASVAQRLGISSPTLLYRWKQQQLHQGGPVASSLDERVRELEAELLRVQRERDILKKALAIFGRQE